jgi:hypothetical protein
MPRIAAISLARLSLRNIPKKRLLQLINLIIFISLFAVTAAIISLVFEKKIEEQNEQLSNEYGNEIIYNLWLSEAPKNIRNIESVLNQISKEHNYLIYIQGLDKILVTERDLAHNPVVDLIKFNRLGIKSIDYSLKDALIVSSSLEDIEEINKYKKVYREIKDKFYSAEVYNKIWILEYPEMIQNWGKEEITNLYKRALSTKEDLKKNLDEIKNFNINFNVNFYSQKKSESQIKISNIKNKIKQLSNNESTSIFIAFIIQLIIFLIIQFFEFGFELTQKAMKRVRK